MEWQVEWQPTSITMFCLFLSFFVMQIKFIYIKHKRYVASTRLTNQCVYLKLNSRINQSSAIDILNIFWIWMMNRLYPKFKYLFWWEISFYFRYKIPFMNIKHSAQNSIDRYTEASSITKYTIRVVSNFLESTFKRETRKAR